MTETFPRTIGGREILFRPPTQAQLLIVGRLVRTSRQFVDTDDKEMDRVQIQGGVEKMSMILDVIDSMVINPADRDFLEQQMIAGKLDLGELMEAFDTGEDEGEPAKPVKKAVVRKPNGRARSR